VEPIAQTNLQLYNQLRRQNRGDDELALVRQAYDLAAQLYSGYYQADGKPFISHSVGVASIVARLRLPAPFVALGMLHNVYGNADFGDGGGSSTSASRRRLVSAAVGEAVEGLVLRFRDFRLNAKNIGEMEQRLETLDATERNLVITDLADYLEKHIDLGVLYFGDGAWISNEIAAFGSRLVAMARRLEQPALAGMMEEAFKASAEEPPAPQVLRGAPHRQYLELVVPRSCRPRLLPLLVRKIRRSRRR
jgi:hypothetical protein